MLNHKIPSRYTAEQIKEEVIPLEGYRWLQPDEWLNKNDLIWKIRSYKSKTTPCQKLSNGFYVVWELISFLDFEIFAEKRYVRKARIDMPFWGLLQ